MHPENAFVATVGAEQNAGQFSAPGAHQARKTEDLAGVDLDRQAAQYRGVGVGRAAGAGNAFRLEHQFAPVVGGGVPLEDFDIAPDHEADHAPQVDRLARARGREHVKATQHDHEREQGDREVDEEHPAPAERVGDRTAEQRADQAGQRMHAAEHAVVLAELRGREQVADGRLRGRDEHPGADEHAAARFSRPPSPSPLPRRE